MLNFFLQIFHFLVLSLDLLVILTGMGIIFKSIFNTTYFILNLQNIIKKIKYSYIITSYWFLTLPNLSSFFILACITLECYMKVNIKGNLITLKNVILNEFTIKKVLKLLLISILFKIFLSIINVIFIYYNIDVSFNSIYLSKAVYFLLTIIFIYKYINSDWYKRYKLVIGLTLLLIFWLLIFNSAIYYFINIIKFLSPYLSINLISCMLEEEWKIYDHNELLDSKRFKLQLNEMINLIKIENENLSNLFYSKWKTVHLLGIIVNTNYLNQEQYIKLLKDISLKGIECNDIKDLMKSLPLPLGFNYFYILDQYFIDKGEHIYVQNSLATYWELPLDKYKKIIINSEEKKYYYWTCFSDFNNKNLIDFQNFYITPFNKTAYFNEWNYFKNYNFIWFIEGYANWFLRRSPLILRLEFDNFNILDFVFSKILYINSLEVEKDLLYKFKYFLEDYNNRSYSIKDREYLNLENLFFKYWARQLSFYCDPQQLKSGGYTINMYLLNNVYLELLENILYVESKLGEFYVALNSIIDLYPNLCDLQRVSDQQSRIDFYNNIFNSVEKDFICKNIEIYKMRRFFLAERLWTKLSEEDFLFIYKELINKKTYLFNSNLSKENKNIYF